MATYAKVEEVAVGTPATYFIGSDRYATQVTTVTYYKSGNLKGLVKSIEAAGLTFRPYLITSRGEDNISWQQAPRQWWGVLGLGYADDYRDPHF